MGNLSESPQLSRALQLARTVLDGILASCELTQANEETQSVTVVTPSDPSVRAMLGPALRHPGSRVLAPNKTSHRKSEDNKSCLVLMLPVHSLFIGKAKQPASRKEGNGWRWPTAPWPHPCTWVGDTGTDVGKSTPSH